MSRKKCPKCSTGFVIFELIKPHPPADHCIICGWHEWKGVTIRKPAKHEAAEFCRQPEPIKSQRSAARKGVAA